MIDIIRQTPHEYSAQSRDYQVLARLYTALYNYVKMYIDNLSIWDTNIDNKLINLRARTLNFIPEHSWDTENNSLEAITTCFKYLMRQKGTIKALEYCIDILMRLENIPGEELDQVVTLKNYNVTIRVPEDLLTLGVIEDLVKYLLPAGLTYNIIKYKSYNAGNIMTDIFYREEGTDMISRSELPYTDRMYIGNNSITSSTKYYDNTESPNKIDDTYVYTDDFEITNGD